MMVKGGTFCQELHQSRSSRLRFLSRNPPQSRTFYRLPSDYLTAMLSQLFSPAFYSPSIRYDCLPD